MNPKLTDQARLASHQSPWSPSVLVSPGLGLQVHYYTQLFMWMLGSKLRSSCFMASTLLTGPSPQALFLSFITNCMIIIFVKPFVVFLVVTKNSVKGLEMVGSPIKCTELSAFMIGACV